MTRRFAINAYGLVFCALLGLPPLPARAVEACTQESKTIVCLNRNLTIRVIAETTSPSGRYAIEWIVPPIPAKEFKRNPEDGSLVVPGFEPENVVVRMRDGAVVTTMQSTHFGDDTRYNHREITAIWSADERLLLVWSNDKWDTLASEILRFDRRGRLTGRDDVLALVRRLGKERLSHRKGINEVRLYEPLILKERLRGADQVEVTTALAIPKSEDELLYDNHKTVRQAGHAAFAGYSCWAAPKMTSRWRPDLSMPRSVSARF